MSFLDFSYMLKKAIDSQNNVNDINQYFLNELEKLTTTDKTHPSLKMTQASVLFEGFYLHLDESDLKKILTKVKAKRWIQHFGTPTVTFLLTYQTQINETKQFFDEYANLRDSFSHFPWVVNKENDYVIDSKNDVFIDPKSISRVVVPKTKEATGMFTQTHNPFGGFTTTPCDPISQKFIERAEFTA